MNVKGPLAATAPVANPFTAPKLEPKKEEPSIFGDDKKAKEEKGFLA